MAESEPGSGLLPVYATESFAKLCVVVQMGQNRHPAALPVFSHFCCFFKRRNFVGCVLLPNLVHLFLCTTVLGTLLSAWVYLEIPAEEQMEKP